MKNDNILAFAQNLQTTDKIQAGGTLVRKVPVRDDLEAVGFCCLGVQSVDLGFIHIHEGQGCLRLENGHQMPMALAPRALAEWLGFDVPEQDPEDSQYNFEVDWDEDLSTPPYASDDGTRYVYTEPDGGIDTLAALNDQMKPNMVDHEFTFAQIGDIVRHFGLKDIRG